MLKYTVEEDKVMNDYNNLLSEANKLDSYMQTEEFKKLSPEDRTDKVMQVHHLKNHLADLYEQIKTFVPTEVPDKPAKTMGLGDGINKESENLN